MNRRQTALLGHVRDRVARASRTVPPLVLAACLASGTARAVLIIGPTDPGTGQPTGGQNIGPPGGALANSGAQFEGLWQTFYTGTAIAPNYFITAAHVGGNVGDTFSLQGTDYTTTAKFVDPNSPDIAIWQVNHPFSSYAPIFTGNDEQGSSMITYGRGGPPGPSTASNGTTNVPIHGFQWTSGTPQNLSWGTNTITFAGPVSGAPTGQYLAFQFNQALGPNTGGLSSGDSGGGVFIMKNGVWQLAGINYGTDAPYNTLPASDPNSANTVFYASLYDERGIYLVGSNTPVSGSSPVPSVSVATRLTNEFGFISAVTGIPEPSSVVLLFAGLVCTLPLLRRRPADRGGSDAAPG